MCLFASYAVFMLYRKHIEKKETFEQVNNKLDFYESPKLHVQSGFFCHIGDI